MNRPLTPITLHNFHNPYGSFAGHAQQLTSQIRSRIENRITTNNIILPL